MADPTTKTQTPTRIALVGAGFIARVHLQLLAKVPGVLVVAICDPCRERAAGLAGAHGIRHVFKSLDAMLADSGLGVDAVHLLVPPPLHLALAKQCLEAGLHVLVEKPLALAPAEAEELGRLAAAQAVRIGVNHNLTFDANVQRLRSDLRAGRLGKLEHLNLVHHVPLRQLDTGDVGHFMFQGEANILLEQAVHPFSLVCSLLGPSKRVTAHVGAPRQLPHGGRFFDTWMVAMECEGGTAQVLLAFGRTMHEARCEALCSDGRVQIDLLRGTYQRSTKSRWLEVLDIAIDGGRRGLGLVRQGAGRLLRYGLALFRLASPSEPFLRSMAASLRAFHVALRRGEQVPVGAGAAADVLRMCQQTATAAGVSQEELSAVTIPTPGPVRPDEVVITGGTGFVGRHVVEQLLQQRRHVTLLVRRPQLLSAGLLDRGVRVFVGDATDGTALAEAAAGARVLVHLATCAAANPDDAAAMEAAMAGSVATAAAACQAGVQRLVYVSSTAALYLGGGNVVSGDVDPDPLPALRPPYARGKVAAEHELRRQAGKVHETVCLRPGIVVGAGGVLEHSGVGLWTRDNHCVGWGGGHTPLPFVLVTDCADAIVRAVSAPAAAGKRYNLAGDVRLTARQYVAALAKATGRPYHFHPQWRWWLWTVERAKYLIKWLARRPAARVSRRDLRSRAFLSSLDTGDVKRDLGWQPVADRETFLRQALRPGDAGDAPQSVPLPETVVSSGT
ncbi:MAG: NAD-dependent epimerase/dehydratase family protein [Planctomycetota bacterium]|jgi:predicted dehydrogenase/nucleoside-diphosphate-sugar epimerase